ncbi:hypothetical protein [Thiothrix subterranea]|uniref:CBM-cenC domain-containing protein n=2 Tax=Thiothrix subterranea TaxID=2735563 RepID=A0AA51MQJ7_9GAMM|nr:hypothetical protein [Thiothrix subterranea]MDQ5767578.1 hypothetical protein [Thiothrix subterranea]WML88540.1 hypothetical protein RCG00_09215 [Thiothrix subterranea]
MWLRLVLIAVLSLLGWQVVERGMGQMYSERLAAIYTIGWVTPWVDAVDSIPPDSALSLSADAWASLSDQALVRGLHANAETYAWRALNRDMSSGRAVARLLALRDTQQQLNEADKLAHLAYRLWPVHSDALLRVASHWIVREDLKQLLPILHVLMTQTGEYNQALFPALHELAKSDEAVHLKQYVSQAPQWWPAFFSYLCQQESDLAIVTAYYRERLKATQPLQQSEQTPYINRLIKDQQWQQARDIWITTLSEKQQKFATTFLYDSGFESDRYNEGFAWHLNSTPLVTINTGSTGGITGKQALRIAFKTPKKPIHFQQIWQRLTLPADHYTLTLRYRADNFITAKGLQWRMYCDTPTPSLLGESQILNASKDWKTLSMNLKVPQEITSPVEKDHKSQPCAAQILRLEAASRYAHEHLFEGTLWIDDIAITSSIP